MSHINFRIVVVVLLAASASIARAADIEVKDAWIRLLPAGVPAGGYMTIHNRTGQSIVLTGASSGAYGHVMLHRTVEQGGISRMLPVDRIEIPAGSTLAFAPGGYHVMLTKPNYAIAAGERVPVTLEFSDKHRITARFDVRGPSDK